jgi:hypothetical protein
MNRRIHRPSFQRKILPRDWAGNQIAGQVSDLCFLLGVGMTRPLRDITLYGDACSKMRRRKQTAGISATSEKNEGPPRSEQEKILGLRGRALPFAEKNQGIVRAIIHLSC